MYTLQKIVELYDLMPIRIFIARRPAMQCCNRRLECISARIPPKSLIDQRQGFGNLTMIPAAAILLFQNYQIAGAIETSFAPRVLQKHEGKQSSNVRGWLLRRRGHQRFHQARQADGFGAKVGPQQWPALSGGIAFVKDQVDNRQHRFKPRRHLLGLGDDVRNSGISNLALGADQPLRHGRRRDQKCPRDLIGSEAAKGSQGQRNLGLQGKRRVAAGENQAKPVVRNFAAIVIRLFDGADLAAGDVQFKFLFKSGPPANAINGLVAGGLDDPGAGKLRDA